MPRNKKPIPHKHDRHPDPRGWFEPFESGVHLDRHKNSAPPLRVPWTQIVLPETFDDALSYQELIYKLFDLVNEHMAKVHECYHPSNMEVNKGNYERLFKSLDYAPEGATFLIDKDVTGDMVENIPEYGAYGVLTTIDYNVETPNGKFQLWMSMEKMMGRVYLFGEWSQWRRIDIPTDPTLSNEAEAADAAAVGKAIAEIWDAINALDERVTKIEDWIDEDAYQAAQVMISSSNYSTYMSNANSADEGRTFYINSNVTSSMVSNLPEYSKYAAISTFHATSDNSKYQIYVNDTNAYIRSYLNGAWSAWRDIDTVVDTSLTISGAAADSKTVGDLIAALQSEIDSIEENITKIKTTISDIQSDISNINSSITTINIHLTTVDNSITDIKGDITTIEGDITSIEGDISTIENNITNINTKITNINTDIGDLETRVSNCESNITTINSNISTIQGDITTIKSNITTIQGDITDLSSRVSTNESNISTIQGNITSINSKISTIESTITEIQNELSTLFSNTSTLASAVDSDVYKIASTSSAVYEVGSITNEDDSTTSVVYSASLEGVQKYAITSYPVAATGSGISITNESGITTTVTDFNSLPWNRIMYIPGSVLSTMSNAPQIAAGEQDDVYLTSAANVLTISYDSTLSSSSSAGNGTQIAMYNAGGIFQRNYTANYGWGDWHFHPGDNQGMYGAYDTVGDGYDLNSLKKWAFWIYPYYCENVSHDPRTSTGNNAMVWSYWGSTSYGTGVQFMVAASAQGGSQLYYRTVGYSTKNGNQYGNWMKVTSENTLVGSDSTYYYVVFFLDDVRIASSWGVSTVIEGDDMSMTNVYNLLKSLVGSSSTYYKDFYNANEIWIGETRYWSESTGVSSFPYTVSSADVLQDETYSYYYVPIYGYTSSKS